MPRLVTSIVQTGLGVDGKMFWLRPTSDVSSTAPSEFKEMGLPAGTHAARRRPSWSTYSVLGRTRMYGVGSWSANVLIDENFRFMRQSIPAPTSPPSISSSGTGITGECIPYVRFKDSIANRVGPVSEGGGSVTLTNQGRSWSGIPTTCPDPSVDTVEGLVSMDGATPRVAWTRDLGTTTVTENVATLALGEAADDFTDMPYGTINNVFHDRQWVSGNILDPTSVAGSALGFMERYEGLKFATDGENVNSLFTAGSGEIQFYGSRERIYRLTGFTEEDFAREVERKDMGTINHAGVVMVHKRLIVPTTIGFFLYDGSWHLIGEERQTEFVQEYKIWRDDYENAFGFYDPIRNVYTFGPVRHSRIRNRFGTDVWVDWTLNCADLFPESGGNFGAAWGNDMRLRKLASKASFYLPGSAQPLVVSGAGDGFLRAENVADDDDDDDDGDRKRMIVEPGSLMPDTGGVGTDGFTWHTAWSYIESQVKSWIAEFRAGSSQARYRLDPDFEDETAASGAGFAEPVEREVHVLDGVAGDALNYGVVIEKAQNVRFRGFGVVAGPGLGGRFVRGVDARGLGPGQVVNLELDPDGGAWDPTRDECGNPIGSEVVGAFAWTVDPDSLAETALVGYKLEWSDPNISELLDDTLKPQDLRLGRVEFDGERLMFAAGPNDPNDDLMPVWRLDRTIGDPDLVRAVLTSTTYLPGSTGFPASLLGFDHNADGNESLYIASGGEDEIQFAINRGDITAGQDEVVYTEELTLGTLARPSLLGKSSTELFCASGNFKTDPGPGLPIRYRNSGSWDEVLVGAFTGIDTAQIRGTGALTIGGEERCCFLVNYDDGAGAYSTWLIHLNSSFVGTAEQMLTSADSDTGAFDRTMVEYQDSVYWLQRIGSGPDRIVLMKRDDAAWGSGVGEEVFDFTTELSLSASLGKVGLAVDRTGLLVMVAVSGNDVFILKPGDDDDLTETWDIAAQYELGPVDPTMALCF